MPEAPSLTRARIAVTVRGTVQGVGFRPFVYQLAHSHGLAGWVRNSTGPVEIEVEGDPGRLHEFVRELLANPPPLARIESLDEIEVAPSGEQGFTILESAVRPGQLQSVAPDSATCDECLNELFDPADRRYRYPFTNCTNCGPRFTVITALPYDRISTTMRGFTMCAACRQEYEDPGDRRFHAQPIACWDCGPRLDASLEAAVAALKEGLVVAVKGLGGYQLACDARNDEAVERLRRRKHRPSKPFAVMMSEPQRYCLVAPEEKVVLESRARPIVLLRYRGGLASAVAPGLNELGAMLPYTPLHHLLLNDFGGPLVMTSGNLSEEPICRDDQEARERLSGIADFFLSHNRPIAARYDDSVVRIAAGKVRVIRRARGLAPQPLPFPPGPPLVATGAHLKAAFTVARDGHAFVGPHVGDLDDLLTVRSFQETLDTYQRLFHVDPERVACDLHPDYASTRLAEQIAEPVRVQHHHAHVASVVAEHALKGRVIGVAMDGVGLGSDGTAWGGEVVVCEGPAFRRVAHLAAVPLPGGDLCARQGWRMAAAYGLAQAPDGVDPHRFELVRRLAAGGSVQTTTSAGRLFDAVSSLLGVCQESSYEGEAAARLQAMAEPDEHETIEVELDQNVALFARILERRLQGETPQRLAAIFHNSLAGAVVRACAGACEAEGTALVALSGGCFQNRRLLESCWVGLIDAGLQPYANEQVPANDGGVSLGQAWVAACV